MNTELDKIAKRVRKIMALANNNPNEAERDVALRHAANLLAKYNLDMSTIENAPGVDDVGETMPPLCTEKWAMHIVQGICKLYYCQCFISSTESKKQSVIVGTKANTAIAGEMAYWAIESVRKESNRQFKNATERRSFRLGAAIRLYHRAMEIVKEEETREKDSHQLATATGNSLLVIRNQLAQKNDDFLSLKYPDLQTRRSRPSSVIRGAYDAGQSYGNAVGLTRQMD